MDSERYQRIKSIVFEASDLPPAERAGFVESACAGDDALRREVERYLADEPDTSELQAPIAAATKESSTERREPPPPALPDDGAGLAWAGWAVAVCVALGLLALGAWALVDALRFEVPAVTADLGVDERALAARRAAGRTRGVTGAARVLNERAAALLEAKEIERAEQVMIQSLLAAHAQTLLDGEATTAAFEIPDLPELREEQSSRRRALRVLAHIEKRLADILPAGDPARSAIRRAHAGLRDTTATPGEAPGEAPDKGRTEKRN